MELCHTTGHKSLYFFDHILGEMMTALVHSEIYWTLSWAYLLKRRCSGYLFSQSTFCTHFSSLSGQLDIFLGSGTKKKACPKDGPEKSRVKKIGFFALNLQNFFSTHFSQHQYLGKSQNYTRTNFSHSRSEQIW